MRQVAIADLGRANDRGHGVRVERTIAPDRRDSVIVTLNDQPVMSRAAWLQLLETDGPTDVDAQAAEFVRELRERCEGDDTRRP